MVRKIISGGQTGADMGGLLGARLAGLETGGTAPKGWRTEAGPNPDLAAFGLLESPSSGYEARTSANVRAAGATVLFGNAGSPGSRMTLRMCRNFSKPTLVNPTPEKLAQWCEALGIDVLNVAGNRESVTPGLQARVAGVIVAAFGRTGEFEN